MPASDTPNTSSQDEVPPAVVGHARTPGHGQQHGPERHPEEDGAAAARRRRRASWPARAPNCTEATAHEHEKREPARHGTVATGHNRRVAVPPAAARTARPLLRGARGLSGESTRRSRSWTSTRCGRTRRRCWPARAAGRSGWRASRCAAARSCSAMLERDPGFRGLMTFTLAESLWLLEHGFRDLLLAYPTADREGLARLGRLESEGRADRDGRLHRAPRPDRRGRRRGPAGRSAYASSWT